MPTLTSLAQARPMLQLAAASICPRDTFSLSRKSFLQGVTGFHTTRFFHWPHDRQQNAAARCIHQSAPPFAPAAELLPPHPPSQKRVFVNHTIYKGKAAMGVQPMRPTFINKGGNLSVDRDGAMLLEFAPIVSARNYDWNQKQTFALSVTECGALLDLHPGLKPLDFFHDPFKGQQGQEGKIRKKLVIQTSQNNDSYFVALNVSGGGQPISLSLPVSFAEMAVLKTLIQYSIPSLMGWDVWANPDLATQATVTEEGTQLGGTQEWKQ